MNNAQHKEINKKLDDILNLLIVRERLMCHPLITVTPEKPKKLELEDYNFRVNSDGWHKITVDDKEYLENPEKDIWELLEEGYRGEQLFTFDAAMRETKKAGKRMPTDEEWTELIGDDDHNNSQKDKFPNPVYSGGRSTGGAFYYLGSYQYLWSSTPSGGSNAWGRNLYSSYSTVYRYADSRAYGFSVRWLK